MFVELGVGACGARTHHAFGHAGGKSLAHFSGLHGDGLCPHQLGNARRGGAVSTPLHALQIRRTGQWFFGIDALWRPRHSVQNHHALLAQFFLQEGLLRGPQLGRGVVAVGQKGQAISAKNLPLVLEVDEQDFTHLCLPTLHRAFDLGRFEKRGIGMHSDLQFATAGFVNVVGKLRQVFGVEVAGGVGRGQVPFGLGLCARRGQEQGQKCGETRGQNKQAAREFHGHSKAMCNKLASIGRANAWGAPGFPPPRP